MALISVNIASANVKVQVSDVAVCFAKLQLLHTPAPSNLEIVN